MILEFLKMIKIILPAQRSKRMRRKTLNNIVNALCSFVLSLLKDASQRFTEIQSLGKGFSTNNDKRTQIITNYNIVSTAWDVAANKLSRESSLTELLKVYSFKLKGISLCSLIIDGYPPRSNFRKVHAYISKTILMPNSLYSEYTLNYHFSYILK